jgi:hypothetical protein
MFIDHSIQRLALYLRDELIARGNAIFDEEERPRQAMVQRLILHRPALPSEGFPLLACYRTKLQPSGDWEAKFSWHLQASTLIVEDQQNLLVWVSKAITELILEFPEIDPCIVTTTAPQIALGYWLTSSNTAGKLGPAYPSIEGTFTLTDAH